MSFLTLSLSHSLSIYIYIYLTHSPPLILSISLSHTHFISLSLSLFFLSLTLFHPISFFVYRWIMLPAVIPLSLPITKLSRCNEQYCLLTTKRIEHAQDSIRCGRCSGIFHIDSLHILAAPSTTSHAHAIYRQRKK